MFSSGIHETVHDKSKTTLQHRRNQLSLLKPIKVPHVEAYTNFEILSRLDRLLFIIFSIQFYAFVIETLFAFHLFVESLVDITSLYATSCHHHLLKCIRDASEEGNFDEHKSHRKIIHSNRSRTEENSNEKEAKRSQMSR